jgi:Helix-turn-helix of DDE superfamily endonuclease
MTALKYEQALRLNGTDFRRRTGVDPETFAEMEAVLHERETNKGKSGRPPALPVGAQLLLTLEFWREYRTYFHLGQDWGVHETTVQRTVVRVEDALLRSGQFSLPGKKTVKDAGTVFTAVVVDVSAVPCERPKKAGRPHTGAVLPKTAAALVQREKEAPHAEVATPGPSDHLSDPLRRYRSWVDA